MLTCRNRVCSCCFCSCASVGWDMNIILLPVDTSWLHHAQSESSLPFFPPELLFKMWILSIGIWTKCSTVCSYKKLVSIATPFLSKDQSPFQDGSCCWWIVRLSWKRLWDFPSLPKTFSGTMPRRITPTIHWWTFSCFCYHHEEAGCSVW